MKTMTIPNNHNNNHQSFLEPRTNWVRRPAKYEELLWWGGVAGALLGGPVAGIAGAASAAYAAAKRECEMGEAARVAGDTVADASEFLLANQTIHQTLEQYRYRSRRQKQLVDNDINHNNESVQASRRRSFVDECSACASQIQSRASQVKARVTERVSNPFQRRKSRGNASIVGDEGEDDEFHDCCDTEDADFEDTMEEEEQEQVLANQ